MNIDKRELYGWIAILFLTAITSFWMFWSFMELYYEAWGLPFWMAIAYLIPGGICFILTIVSLLWPRVGGSILMVIGIVFGFWWIQLQISRGMKDPIQLFITLFLSGGLAVIGYLLWLQAKLKRQEADAPTPHPNWFRRNLRTVIAIGLPVGIAVGASIGNLPILLTRQDDGDRSARIIEGNGVRLMWAPAGPGWAKGGGNAGDNLSWNQIALYGLAPVGTDLEAKNAVRQATQAEMDTFCICRYLSADGTTLMDSAQNIWRMPTTQEVVRSLVRHGTNAGCTWDGKSPSAECEILPDKESPLWATDYMPIYMWTRDEYDSTRARFVSYNGRGVLQQDKRWGNPRHGYRCVREPDDSSRLAIDTSSVQAATTQ